MWLMSLHYNDLANCSKPGWRARERLEPLHSAIRWQNTTGRRERVQGRGPATGIGGRIAAPRADMARPLIRCRAAHGPPSRQRAATGQVSPRTTNPGVQ